MPGSTPGSKPSGPEVLRLLPLLETLKSTWLSSQCSFLLPLNLTQSSAKPWAKNNPWKGKKEEYRVEREDSVRMGPLV